MPPGVPNLASTVDRFSVETTRIEIGPPTLNDHNLPIDGTVTASTILAHTFPAPGAKLTLLEDGLEVVDEVEIHTSAVLHGGSEATGQPPSRIVWNGQQYEMRSIAPRSTGPDGEITWRVCTAVLVPPVELPP